MGRPGERTNIATANAGIGISFHCVIAICKTSFAESKEKAVACQNLCKERIEKRRNGMRAGNSGSIDKLNPK